MNNISLVEQYEDKLRLLVEEMRDNGIREETIRFLLDQEARNSELKIIAKYDLADDTHSVPPLNTWTSYPPSA